MYRLCLIQYDARVLLYGRNCFITWDTALLASLSFSYDVTVLDETQTGSKVYKFVLFFDYLLNDFKINCHRSKFRATTILKAAEPKFLLFMHNCQGSKKPESQIRKCFVQMTFM